MSDVKQGHFEIENYKFGQLVPSDAASSKEIKEFKLRSLADAGDFKQNISEETVRTEREMEAEAGFSISPEVREQRGLKEQEESDIERKISEEVERRIAELKDQAYNEGFSAGEDKGREAAYAEASEKYNLAVDEFSSEIEALTASQKEIYNKSKEEAYLMVKNLTKWIILKEVDEKYYLVRLLEKLIHEINAKSNLVIRVNEGAFGYMPEVVKIVERKLGKLTNVRVEVDLDQERNGIVLESENTIVDGSLETQFKSIDRIFENAGINE